MNLGLRLLVMTHFSCLATRGILRSFSRDTHTVVPVKQDLWPSEELVDLLERQEPGLGVEEVYERDEDGVEDAEVYVCLPSDAGD